MKKNNVYLYIILNAIIFVTAIIVLNQYKYYIIYGLQRNISDQTILNNMIISLPGKINTIFILGAIFALLFKYISDLIVKTIKK